MKENVFRKTVVEALGQRMQAMTAQADVLARQSVDGVHDMRVASRRLRAALRAFRPWLPGKQREAVRIQVREITRLLGRPRELDVMLGMLTEYPPADDACEKARVSALAALQKTRNAASESCVHALEIVRASSFQHECNALLKGVVEEEDHFLKVVKEMMIGYACALNDQYRVWHGTEDEETLHRLRIAFKKFRYTCEIFAPLYGGKMEHAIQKLKKQQQLLGRWNDCRVLRNELQELHGAGALELEPLITAFDEQRHHLLMAYAPEGETFFSAGEWEKIKVLIKKPAIR